MFTQKLFLGLSCVFPECDKGWAEFQGECMSFSRSPKTWMDAEVLFDNNNNNYR